MLTFYRRLYPFKSIFNWLNHEHAPTRLFTHREFAFTLQGDVYLRYNSFTTADELKKSVCQLNPTRFEIGPIYTARVRSTSIFYSLAGSDRMIAQGQKDSARRCFQCCAARTRVRH